MSATIVGNESKMAAHETLERSITWKASPVTKDIMHKDNLSTDKDACSKKSIPGPYLPKVPRGSEGAVRRKGSVVRVVVHQRREEVPRCVRLGDGNAKDPQSEVEEGGDHAEEDRREEGEHGHPPGIGGDVFQKAENQIQAYHHGPQPPILNDVVHCECVGDRHLEAGLGNQHADPADQADQHVRGEEVHYPPQLEPPQQVEDGSDQDGCEAEHDHGGGQRIGTVTLMGDRNGGQRPCEADVLHHHQTDRVREAGTEGEDELPHEGGEQEHPYAQRLLVGDREESLVVVEVVV
jgi:hypothetical protein